VSVTPPVGVGVPVTFTCTINESAVVMFEDAGITVTVGTALLTVTCAVPDETAYLEELFASGS